MLAAAAWAQSREPIPAPTAEKPAAGFVISTGTELTVRLDDPLSSERNKPGDQFTATLTSPITAGGSVVIPAGTRLSGHILENHPAGIRKGRARLVLRLDSFQMNGRAVPIELTVATFENAHPHKKLEDADPNADSVAGTRIAVTIAETVMHFTLGAPVMM
jgi:hypothetical protein